MSRQSSLKHLLTLLSLPFAVFCASTVSAADAAPLKPHAEKQLLIGFKAGTSAADEARVLARIKGKFIKRMRAQRDVERKAPGIDQV